jgi:hypothetical protein
LRVRTCLSLRRLLHNIIQPTSHHALHVCVCVCRVVSCRVRVFLSHNPMSCVACCVWLVMCLVRGGAGTRIGHS